MINIVLNNHAYRYDVYQIVNLFYDFTEFVFQEENSMQEKTIVMQKDKIISNDDFIINIFENSMEMEFRGSKDILYYEDSLTIKANVKKILFLYLTKLTDKYLPWGTLVGIRPTKIALSLLKQGKTSSEIIESFKFNTVTSEEKTRLCIEVAKIEADLVNKEKNNISIYVGMPFCPTRCLYCSFTSNPISTCKKIVKPYLEALYLEIEAISKFVLEKGLNIENVYFGGGTPTAIGNDEFETTMRKIYEALVEKFSVKEFTVECGRPDSITVEKLNSMKKYGVHRISINPQTMNDDTLKLIGRQHSAEAVIETFNLARKIGFDNINMDVIVGLPGENMTHIKNTCDKLQELKPDSITVHGMSIKRGSRLHENIINNNKFAISNQQELNAMYDETVKLAKEMNLKPYYMYRQKNMAGNMENIGYAKTGKECIYNIQMIEERQTIIALGADAVSKVVFLEENRLERFANVKDVREYINRVNEMVDKKIELLNTLY